MKLLVVNNHDSFVYNIIQILGKLGNSYDVVNNEDADKVNIEKYEKIIISPGPGTPLNASDRGNVDILLDMAVDQDILGVCFGHQLLGMRMGSEIRVMEEPMHGEIDVMVHSDSPLYYGIPEKFHAVRYHSLAISGTDHIVVDCVSEKDGAIMGFHSMDMKRFGVQFHPESYYSEYGEKIISNFLEAC